MENPQKDFQSMDSMELARHFNPDLDTQIEAIRAEFRSMKWVWGLMIAAATLLLILSG